MVAVRAGGRHSFLAVVSPRRERASPAPRARSPTRRSPGGETTMLTGRSVLSRKVVTADPCAPLARARELLAKHRMRHLPVVEHGRLVGVVSDRDLAGRPAPASGKKEHPTPTVRDRMSTSVET